MKKKILKLFLSSGTGIIILGMIILVPVLMIYNFFGGDITSNSGYIEGNMEYADKYLAVLNKNITSNDNGYVNLSRILYFYNENEMLSFDDIYIKNLDIELKNMKPISDVCNTYYASYTVCDDSYIENSSQIDYYTTRPFVAPMDFNKTTITSYFGQERIVYEEFDIHHAWDFASPSETPIHSIGDGIVTKVRFNQQTNTIDVNNGAGNYIEIKYEINGQTYKSLYGHLYPNSTNLKVGDQVVAGQQIATVGTTGYSTGPHLHWEVSLNGTKIDGLELVNFYKE